MEISLLCSCDIIILLLVRVAKPLLQLAPQNTHVEDDTVQFAVV